MVAVAEERRADLCIGNYCCGRCVLWLGPACAPRQSHLDWAERRARRKSSSATSQRSRLVRGSRMAREPQRKEKRFIATNAPPATVRTGRETYPKDHNWSAASAPLRQTT